jgi:hypothetical protein
LRKKYQKSLKKLVQVGKVDYAGKEIQLSILGIPMDEIGIPWVSKWIIDFIARQ